MKKLVLVVCAATLVAGCSKSPAPANGGATAVPGSAVAEAASIQPAPPSPEQGATQALAPTPEAVKPVPATLPEVVARVNGEAIPRSELLDAIASLEGQAGRSVPPEERDQVYRSVLDQLVTGHVLLQESRARKIAVNDAEIESRVATLRQRFSSEDEFAKALASRNLSLDRVRQELRKQMTIERMLEAEVSSKVKVTDQDVKAFYDNNPAQFQQPEAFRASHILIMVPPDATPAQKQEARNKINDVLKEVRAGGDFAELARKHSQDGSASQGGDLNYFSRGQMVEPFQAAVEALQPGQVSGVVETQFGFHIVKLTDKRSARTVPLAEVNQKIGEFLLQQQRQQQANAFVEALKAKSQIEILI